MSVPVIYSCFLSKKTQKSVGKLVECHPAVSQITDPKLSVSASLAYDGEKGIGITLTTPNKVINKEIIEVLDLQVVKGIAVKSSAKKTAKQIQDILDEEKSFSNSDLLAIERLLKKKIRVELVEIEPSGDSSMLEYTFEIDIDGAGEYSPSIKIDV